MASREQERNEATTQRFQRTVEAESQPQRYCNPDIGTRHGSDVEIQSDVFAETSQREFQESPEYVAATESHVGRSKYLASSEIRFREEMVEVRDDSSQLSHTDLELLRVQKAFEMPQRSVTASLIDSFFAYCSPWTPVLELSDVEELQTTEASPLLLNAVLLAGSRVASSNALSTWADEFYRKARLLFILGHERNAITSIIAVTLLQWYNPTGPEHISTSTSGFWVRIAAGLAYQIGLHRDPISQNDKGLRRRLWWSIVVSTSFILQNLSVLTITLCRDDIISIGTGRPRTINLDDSNVPLATIDDFPVNNDKARLFVAYSIIIRLLADLTENVRRKTLTEMRRTYLENALYRWIKDLPTELRLFHDSPKRLNPYSLEARQLSIPYLVTLFILARHSANSQNRSLRVSFLASSFVAGIFEDMLNRDELCHCGPVFTFYAFAAGLAQMPALRYSTLAESAEESLSIIELSLREMKKRWGSAEGALIALTEVKRLMRQTATLWDAPGPDLGNFRPFFDEFGPELCRQYQLLGQIDSNSEGAPLIPSSSFRGTQPENSTVNSLNQEPPSRLQSVGVAESRDPFLTGLENTVFTDLDPFGGWMDDLGLGLASY